MAVNQLGLGESGMYLALSPEVRLLVDVVGAGGDWSS